MKIVLGLGKALALLFWLVVLVNLFTPFAQPFAWLLHLCGATLLLLHGLELALFGARLQGRANLAWERAQVLLFGILRLLELPEPSATEPEAVIAEVSHA
ncbi:hypothetical protein D9M69_320770 [compost metagenome]